MTYRGSFNQSVTFGDVEQYVIDSKLQFKLQGKNLRLVLGQTPQLIRSQLNIWYAIDF